MKGLQLPDGRERLVRHGFGPERVIQTGIGPVEVRRVKLRDRGAHPLHLGDPATLGQTDAKLGRAVADPLPARRLDG